MAKSLEYWCRETIVRFMLPTNVLPKLLENEVKNHEIEFNERIIIDCDENILKWVFDDIYGHAWHHDPYPLDNITLDILNINWKSEGRDLISDVDFHDPIRDSFGDIFGEINTIDVVYVDTFERLIIDSRVNWTNIKRCVRCARKQPKQFLKDNLAQIVEQQFGNDLDEMFNFICVKFNYCRDCNVRLFRVTPNDYRVQYSYRTNRYPHDCCRRLF